MQLSGAEPVLVWTRSLFGKTGRLPSPICPSDFGWQGGLFPIPHSTWNYRFDAVLAGHPLDPVISGALAEMRSRTRQLKVFGSYPAAPAD